MTEMITTFFRPLTIFLFRSGLALLFLFPVVAQAQSDLQYYLIFSARGASLKPFSFGGHAFVTWGRCPKDSVVNAVITYGFYPNKKASLLGVVVEAETGDVLDGYRPNSKGRRVKQLVVKVDSVTWQQTRNQAEGWEGNSYNVIYKNCVDFIDYIAATAGLDTPSTTNWLSLPRKPVNYIRRLWRKNKKYAVRVRKIKFTGEAVGPKAFYLDQQDVDDLLDEDTQK